MKNKRNSVLLAGALVVLLAGAYAAYQFLSANNAPESQNEMTMEKTEAPDFTVYDAEGKEVSLSDFSGTPVVLNFWASWCSPCKGEMPDFDRAYGEYRDDVAFMMVDMVDGQRETVETGSQHVEDQGYSFPVYYDTEQDAAYTYGISAIPSTVFVDGDGYITAGYRGIIDEETLRLEIEKLLGEE